MSDEQRKLVEPLLPKQSRGGRWNDHRTTLDGMLWILRTGAPWRDLPERFGAWQKRFASAWIDRARSTGNFGALMARMSACRRSEHHRWRMDTQRAIPRDGEDGRSGHHCGR